MRNGLYSLICFSVKASVGGTVLWGVGGLVGEDRAKGTELDGYGPTLLPV